jgi:hypothetical protein
MTTESQQHAYIQAKIDYEALKTASNIGWLTAPSIVHLGVLTEMAKDKLEALS